MDKGTKYQKLPDPDNNVKLELMLALRGDCQDWRQMQDLKPETASQF